MNQTVSQQTCVICERADAARYAPGPGGGDLCRLCELATHQGPSREDALCVLPEARDDGIAAG